MKIELAIQAFLTEIDRALEMLSLRHEGPIANLQSWVLTTRRIEIRSTPDDSYFFVIVTQ